MLLRPWWVPARSEGSAQVGLGCLWLEHSWAGLIGSDLLEGKGPEHTMTQERSQV
jgi:hypothetical protein